VSLACLASVRVREDRVVAARRPLRTEIAEGLRFLVHDRLLRVLTLSGGVGNLVLTGYGAITVAYLVRGVGLDAGAAGLLLATGQVGGVLGACVAPWLARTIGSARALLVAKVGTTPLGLLIPLTGPGWRLGFFVVGAVVLVAGIVANNVVSRGFTQAYCPPELMGRINTSMQVVNYGTIPLGALLGGLLAESLGFGATLWILLGGFAAASMILLLSPIRRWRDLPTRPVG
jgi:predicted MFS family arabinose efflux permease